MRAFVIEHEGDDVRARVVDVDPGAFLVDGDVEVAVEWSCLNFKDAMVVRPRSPVARRSPLIGGVDAAGVVTSSSSELIEVGRRVVAHGYGLGTSHHGGFAPRLRCDGSWLTVLPDRMGPRTAMVFGTAGYTAMASVLALEHAGVVPSSGEVLVTGSSGGVGSVAVALLAARGFDVTAMTGKPDEHEALLGLGASRVIDRDGLDDRPDRVLGAERFAGAIDCVGGTMLAAILRVVRWGGAVAASGLVGGATLETTVYPFITRNVALLGVDSVAAPASVRGTVWRALEDALDSATIEALVAKEVGLQGIAAGLEALERGDARRRILVDPAR